MSAFDSALRLVKAEISPSLLNLAFLARRYDPVRSERRYDSALPMNVDESIRDKVILARVMPDLNNTMGTEIHLPLNLAQAERIDAYNCIYRFDDRDTNNRTITQVFEITYGMIRDTVAGVVGGVGGYSSSASQLLKSAKDVLNTTPAPSGTSYISLIAHNTVMVNDVTPLTLHGVLRCVVTNDPNLNNLKPGYHMDFAELVLAATKNYIHTQLNTEIDVAELYAGVALSKITAEIEGFSDAGQIYRDLLKRFHKLGILNDDTQRKRVGRLALGIRPKY